MQKKVYTFLILGIVALLALAACKKSGGEENLKVETTPTVLNNHVESPAPGPDFPLLVSIKSKMPAGGVKIDVVARQEGVSTPFFTESRNTTSTDNNFS